MINYLPPREVEYQDLIYRLFPEKTLQVKKKVMTITFQVTEDCCMACTYCYQHNKSSKKMTFETAKIFIDQLLADEYECANRDNTFTVILDFIGGEPLMEIELIGQIWDYFLTQMIQLEHPWLLFSKMSIASNGLLYNTPKVQQFFQKYEKFCSLSISVDGNKELHDQCRIDTQGNATYDRVISAVHQYKNQFGHIPNTKMTIAPENVNYIKDAIINLINEGYTIIMVNCMYEDVWNLSHATTLYYQLKELSDYLIENDLYNKIFIRMLDERMFQPLPETDNINWCGGVDNICLSINHSGNVYPCLRYMESSLNGKQPPIIVGDIYNGYLKTEEHINNNKKISNITRRSQSTDECFYCPVAAGCSWCSAYNYEMFGTPNKRATYICNMHKAQSLANVYYWNKLYQYLNIDKQFKLYLPKADALKFIPDDEYNYLLSISQKENII